MSQLIPKVKSGDWQSVVLFADVITRAIAPSSDFTMGDLTLTGLTASRLIMSDLNGTLTSLDAITAPLDLTGTALTHLTTEGYIHLPSGGATNQILKNSGTAGTGAWGTVTENDGALGAVTTVSMSGQLTNTLATGTSPFAVTSTTLNTNLNADLLDGQHASSFLTSESDTLATVVARGNSADATINVGVSNTLTLASGSITDSTGSLNFSTTKLFAGYTVTNNVGFAASVNILSTPANTLPDTLSGGLCVESAHSISSSNPSFMISGQFWNSSTGSVNGAKLSNQIYSLFGGSTVGLENTKATPGGRSASIYGLRFSAQNDANWTPTGTIGNHHLVTSGCSVLSSLGFLGRTISGAANVKAESYGLDAQSVMNGTYNALGTGLNFGGRFITSDSITDGTGNIISYGAYIQAAASRSFTSGGTLTSWGIYQASAVINAIAGKLRIGDVIQPTEDFEVSGTSLFLDKAGFSQSDMNEFLASLDDGYMDYGATTAHRFNNDVAINGDISADNLSISNWNTAYGWGNHASAGYLTGITGESIGDLSDVDLTNIEDGSLLQYDEGDGSWECVSIIDGGGSA